MIVDPQSSIGIIAAALGGAAIGVEREWSGHASGPEAHFAGVRTFTMLGGLAGIAGWLWSANVHALSVVLLTGGVSLVLVAYLAISRHQTDGTTEVAALVVLAAGILAGLGQFKLASGVIAVTALLLVEKSALHRLVGRIDDAALRAGFRFAVMAVVILPLLPPGPYGPLGGIRPRQLWVLVLFFSGLSFAGYVARRFVGARRGYLVSGLLGGMISSTSVAFSFSQLSRKEKEASEALAMGVVAACSLMCVRVLIASTVLNERVARALLLYLAAPFLLTAPATVIGAWRDRGNTAPTEPPANPLQFTSALQMAALFQIVLFAVTLIHSTFGQSGIMVSAGVLGLTDVDALVIAMTRGAIANESASIAARAIAIGALTNTLLKMILAVSIGRGRFRTLAGAGLAMMAAAFAVTLLWLR